MAQTKKKKESINKKLQDKIFLKKESAWIKIKDHKPIFSFGEKYKKFLEISKTERTVAINVINALKKSGFKEISTLKSLKKGDKVFKVIKNKAVLAAHIGINSKKINLIAAHTDSPRLDLKPHPLYEDSELALLQSHYYGGIKKYQWVNTPLSLHGVIYTKSGKEIILNIGDKEDEPIFLISDLLPHLAKDQIEKTGRKIITGEDLNIIFGSIPINDKDITEKVKFNILKKLNKDFGIVEADFAVAELEFVPSNKPRDVGMDRSLIASYGHDDKVCTYTELRAILDIKKTPLTTAVAFFVDKEEIGSDGNTGASSNILPNFIRDYLKLLKINLTPFEVLENSIALTADVTSALNPSFKSVQDEQNASYLGHGISIEKYGGGGGKYGTSDASAEYMHFLRTIANNKKIPYQTGENGRVDQGGGGTIGIFLAKYGLDTADVGPCVLAMHSPYEVVSKVDVYSTYLYYKAFFEN